MRRAPTGDSAVSPRSRARRAAAKVSAGAISHVKIADVVTSRERSKSSRTRESGRSPGGRFV